MRLPDPTDNRAITVAWKYDAELGEVSFYPAFCSPEDQFSRKKGRWISEGRLKYYDYCLKFELKPKTEELIPELLVYIEKYWGAYSKLDVWLPGFILELKDHYANRS
jgi:hypothetical protein